MFAMLSIALLTATSANFADAEAMRISYSNCLTDYTVEQLDLKVGAGTFKKAIQEACSTERDAMFNAIKKDEIEYDSSEQDAIDYANEEVESVWFAFADGYTGYMNSSTRPMKE